MADFPTSEAELPRADDRLTLGIQAGMRTGVGSSPAPQVVPVDMSRIIDGARATLEQANVNPDEFSPNTLQTFGAYFRSENTVGSALSSKSLSETMFPTPDSPVLSNEQLLANINRDGLGPHTNLFEGVRTAAEYQARAADLKRELEDQRIMAASGTMSSVAAMLASGVIDLPTLLPGSVGVKLGAKGVSGFRAAAGVGAAAAIDATATEAALQYTQVDRSWEESAFAVGGSIILGGALGSGLHALARKSLGDAATDAIEARLERTVHDLAEGMPGGRSAGAAAVDAYETLRRSGIDDTKPASSLGMIDMLAKLGDIPGFIGENARIPMLDLMTNSQSPSARSALTQLSFLPATKGEIATDAATVHGLVRDNLEKLSDIAGESRKEFNAVKNSFKGWDDFDRQVTHALLNPDGPSHPSVAKVAKMHREVYTQILDDLIEAKVLPKEVKEKYGDTYVPLMFDGMQIKGREGEFKELIAEGFRKSFEEDAQNALIDSNLRKAQNTAKKGEITGFTQKVDILDDQGNPVINPATGRVRQRKQVVQEGEYYQRERIAKEQYELERQRIQDEQRIAKEIHDKETNFALQKINETYDNLAIQAQKDADETLLRAAQGQYVEPPKVGKKGSVSEFQKKSYEDRKAASVAAVSAQLKRDRDAIEAERRRGLDAAKEFRRDDYAKMEAKYADELADAKSIRDDAILDAKEKAKLRTKAEMVKVREGLEGPLRFTRDGKVDPDIIKQEADKLAQHWYERTTGWGRYTMEHELDGMSDFLKKRRTPVAHTELVNRGFVQGQSFSMLEDYVRMAGVDAAQAKVMKKAVKEKGPDGKVLKDGDLIDIGDLKLNGVKADIIADYDQLRQSILSSPDFKAKEAKITAKYEKQAEKLTSDTEKQKLFDQQKAELESLKAEVETKLANQRDRDIANIEAVLDGIRGTYRHGWSTSAMKAVEAVSLFNVVRLMGGMVVSSFTDPLKIAIATGMGNMVRGAMLAYHQGINKAWDKASAAEKGMTKATAWAMELNLQSRIAQMTDLGNPLRVEDTSSVFMRRVSDVFSKATGITWWNAFWKQTSENATSAYLGQLAHKGFDKLSTSERKWLDSLRINKDGLELIRQQHELQPHSKWHGDWPLLDHHSWDDPQAARLVRHALAEEINNQVVSPQANDKMLFARSPGGRLVMQFRQHMFSNQMRFIGRQLQLASEDTHKAAALGMGFFGLVMAGAVVDYLKNVTGQISPTGNVDKSKSATERYMEEWSKTPGLALYNALDRSDTIGIAMEGSNIIEKLGLPSPKRAMSFAFGDDPAKLKEASRYRNRSAIDAVGGPTLGLANDAVAAASTLGKVVTGQRITRGDYRASERIIPGQNIPYIQFMTNAFERHVGDVYSWPNPK